MRFIKRNIPIFITGIVLLVIFLFVIFASQSKPSVITTLKTVDEADLIADHTYILGFPEAPLSLVIFSNYRNMDELAYLDAIYEVYKENPRYLSVALRPLPTTEDEKLVAKAAQIAGDQGKYWEYAVVGLENSSEEASENNLLLWAKNLELNTKEFEKDLKNADFEKLIESDIKDAEKLEVTTTPTFFLNKQRLFVKDAQDLKEQLESEIARIKKEKSLEKPTDTEEIIEEPKEKELTAAQKKRIETVMEIKYTEEGWNPSEAQPFKGEPVRWINTTDKAIYLQPLDKTYEGLKGIVEIKPGEYFEYKFPTGGLFYYQEMATFNWGMVIIDW
jgi:protein-disulfide isomerase